MGEISLKRLWVLMATAFVDMVGFSLVLPLLPRYAERLGASPSTTGFLLASFALAQLVTAPYWGRLSDRVGRRPVIVGSQVLAAVAFLIFAWASVLSEGSWPLVLLLFSRLAQGAGAGTISVNQAYVSDAVKPEQRAQALGWITACTSAGVMIGPAVGSLGIAWTQSYAAPGLIAAALAAANVAFAWHWLPEAAPRKKRDAPLQQRSVSSSLFGVVRWPGRPAHVLIWVYTSGMLAFMSAISVFSLYLFHRFGIADEEVGYFYAATGFVSMMMRAFLLGHLVKLLGEVRLMRLGTVVLATGLMLAPLATSPLQFLFFALSIPTGTALLFPSTTALISRFADPGEAGQVHGVQQAFGGASRLLAPILALSVYQLHPPESALAWGGALPYWISAGIVTVTLVLSLRVRPGGRRSGDRRPEVTAADMAQA